MTFYVREYSKGYFGLRCQKDYKWYAWTDGKWVSVNQPSLDDLNEYDQIDQATAKEYMKKR